MPTLMRFVTVLFVLGVIVGGAMLALAYLVEPEPRTMTITIPQERLQPRR